MAEENNEEESGIFPSGFIGMLIFSVLADGFELIDVIFGGIPVISWFVDAAAALIIGKWLKKHGGGILETQGGNKAESSSEKKSSSNKSEEKNNEKSAKSKPKSYVKRMVFSYVIEQFPILGTILPTWTLNVISTLRNKKIFFLSLLAMIVCFPLLVLGIVNLLFTGSASASPTSGHSIEYPTNTNKQTMIDCINNYIKNYSGSPYNGMGEDFVSAGEQYNIHPGYIVAMSVRESSLCTDQNAGCLCFPYDNSCFNSWGRKKSQENPTCCDDNNWTKYPSWKDGIYKHTEYIKRDYFDKGKKTVEAITPIYCPSCNVEEYAAFIVSESEKAACAPLTTIGSPVGEAGHDHESLRSFYDQQIKQTNPNITVTISSPFCDPRSSNRCSDCSNYQECISRCGDGYRHFGYDFPMPDGTEIVAAYPGTVIQKVGTPGIYIQSEDKSHVVAYFHVKPKEEITVGMHVDVGTPIGNIVSAGSGPHLDIKKFKDPNQHWACTAFDW